MCLASLVGVDVEKISLSACRSPPAHAIGVLHGSGSKQNRDQADVSSLGTPLNCTVSVPLGGFNVAIKLNITPSNHVMGPLLLWAVSASYRGQGSGLQTAASDHTAFSSTTNTRMT